MSKVAANTLRSGNVIDYNGKLWIVTKNELFTPGKGASVAQVEMRDVRTGNKDNVRFRTQEMIERVRLDQDEYQYLYKEGDSSVFMHVTSYEQISIKNELIGRQANFLQEGMIVEVESFEGEALGVKLPTTVIMTLVECEPVIKGQTATTSYKPGILENGEKIMIPPHVGAGTRVVIRTEDCSYLERAKD